MIDLKGCLGEHTLQVSLESAGLTVDPGTWCLGSLSATIYLIFPVLFKGSFTCMGWRSGLILYHKVLSTESLVIRASGGALTSGR